jgi:hypothetical protein
MNDLISYIYIYIYIYIRRERERERISYLLELLKLVCKKKLMLIQEYPSGRLFCLLLVIKITRRSMDMNNNTLNEG